IYLLHKHASGRAFAKQPSPAKLDGVALYILLLRTGKRENDGQEKDLCRSCRRGKGAWMGQRTDERECRRNRSGYRPRRAAVSHLLSHGRGWTAGERRPVDFGTSHRAESAGTQPSL